MNRNSLKETLMIQVVAFVVLVLTAVAFGPADLPGRRTSVGAPERVALVAGLGEAPSCGAGEAPVVEPSPADAFRGIGRCSESR